MTRRAACLIGAAGGLAGAALALAIHAAPWLGAAGWALLLGAGGGLLAVLCARLYVASITDDATGLYNRRFLFGRLARELRRARRDGAPLTLIVLEVDDMKRCNDSHGHLAGDALLLAVARTLRAGVRRGDTVARWGGDEFGIILPRTRVDDALVMAERLRVQVAKLAVPTRDGQLARTTISVGVATCLHPGDVLELVDRADSAMYRAKQQKNRVLAAA